MNLQSRWGNALIYFCAYGMTVSSILKFVHPAKVVAYMGFLGYDGATYFLIAGVELLAAALFLKRSTQPVGLLLVSAYFGGAISAHLAHHLFVAGGPFLHFNADHRYLGMLPATVFLAAAWSGAWLRHAEARWSAGNVRATESGFTMTETEALIRAGRE